MSIQSPTLIQKPELIDFTGRGLIFKFEVQSDYEDFEIYDVRLNLIVNDTTIRIQERQINGIVTIDASEEIKAFFNRNVYAEETIFSAEKVSFTFNYLADAKVENQLSGSTYEYTEHFVYNMHFSDNLKDYLAFKNMSIIDYCNANKLPLAPNIQAIANKKTAPEKKEYFSFIQHSAATNYKITYQTSNLGEVIITNNYSFALDTVYTIDVSLNNYSNYANVTSYKVEVGNISQNYIVDKTYKKQSVELIYLNSFNLFESVLLEGESKRNAVFSRMKFLAEDKYRTYDNKFVYKFEFNTQYLYDNEMIKLIELLNSSLILTMLHNRYEELILQTTDFKLNTDESVFNTNKINAESAKVYDAFVIDYPEIQLSLNPLAVDFAEQLEDEGNEYTMFSRVAKNPINNNIINTFKLAISHTNSFQWFFIRISRDEGKTFTSLDGTEAWNKVLLDDYVNNPTPVYTKTGRLIVFFQWAASTSATRSKSTYMYSDDDGLNWSPMYDFADPDFPNIIYNSYFISNEIIYNDNGELLLPYWVRIVEIGRSAIFIAKSSDNGVNWDPEYAQVFDNATGNMIEVIEPEWTDCGNGNIFMIARPDRYTNAAGHLVPVVCYSSDYGRTWGNSAPLSIADIENKVNKSGFLYLEGTNTTMGETYAFNVPIPSVNMMEINGEKWLVIFVWIRNDNDTLETLQRMYVLKFSDFLTSGVDAAKAIGTTIIDGNNHGGANRNGGNGCGQIFGEDIIFTTYAQETSSSTGGTTTVYINYIKQQQIIDLITAYNNA